MAGRMVALLLLAVAVLLGAANTQGRALGGASVVGSDQGQLRTLLGNQPVPGPRETWAVSASRDAIDRQITTGNGAADGIKTAVRVAEIGRIASDKAARPIEYDRPGSVGATKKGKL